jgi:hypothetical protein
MAGYSVEEVRIVPIGLEKFELEVPFFSKCIDSSFPLQTPKLVGLSFLYHLEERCGSCCKVGLSRNGNMALSLVESVPPLDDLWDEPTSLFFNTSSSGTVSEHQPRQHALPKLGRTLVPGS